MNDIQRGEEAHRVLNAEIYQEAFRTIEERLVAQLSTIEITKERADYLRTLLIANRKIKGYLEQVMVTGQLAEQQQSLMERLRGKEKQAF